MTLNHTPIVFWEEYSGGHSIRAETGYEEDTIDYIWQHYHHTLPRQLHKAEYFYKAYQYVHSYPKRGQSHLLGISSTKVQEKILPTLHQISINLDEIHWEDRLNYYNHTPDFPLYVTGVLDTVPIYVLNPVNSTLNHSLHNPKYGNTIYKALLCTDFLGRLIFYSFPHLGLAAYDGHIWNDTAARHPTYSWEYLLGDGHFIANDDVLTPFRQNGQLTIDQHLYNAVLQHYRSRSEHVNHIFNCHGAFQTSFRGGVDLMTDCADLTAHTTNVELHRYVRYPLFGPWGHYFEL